MQRPRGVFASALALSVLSLVHGLSPTASGETAARTFTVGDFVLLYCRSIHLTLAPGATPAAAYEALKAAKAVPSETLELDAPLTQKVVVQVGKAARLRLKTSQPGREVSRAEAELFLDRFGILLTNGGNAIYAASDNPPGDPASHANTEKGRKKGRPFFSLSEPE